MAEGAPLGEVRRPVAALRAAAVLCRQQRPAGHLRLYRQLQRRPVCRLPSRSGRQQGTRQPRRSLDAPPQSRRALRPGRLQGDPGAHAEPRHALGVHAARGREGQPTGQLRPDNGSGDPRAGWQPREPRALQGLQERLRAPRRRRVAAIRGLGRAWRLRHFAVHGGDRRKPAVAAQPAVLLRVGGQLRPDQRARHADDRLRGVEASG